MRLRRKIPLELDVLPVPLESGIANAIGIGNEWKTRHREWVPCRDAGGACRAQHGLSLDHPGADASADLRKNVATIRTADQGQGPGIDFPMIHHDALALGRFRICRSPRYALFCAHDSAINRREAKPREPGV